MAECVRKLIGAEACVQPTDRTTLIEFWQVGGVHAPRACCTACFDDATAAAAFMFVLRNSLGTWKVPNLLC